MAGGRGHDDGIEGGMFFPAVIAVAKSYADIVIPQPGQPFDRLFTEFLDDFNAVDSRDTYYD